MTITRFCPSCGTERNEGERFCRNCGAALGTGSTQLRRTLEPAAPASEPTGQLPPVAGPGALPPPPADASAPVASQAILTSPSPPALATTAAPTGRAMPRLPSKPLALAGGLAIALAVFLPWASPGAGSVNALDVPIEALWDLEADEGPVKLGFALLALGGMGAGLSFVPRWGWVRRFCGSVALAMTLGFALQLYRSVEQLGGSFGDVFDVIGVGVLFALAGAIALQVSR